MGINLEQSGYNNKFFHNSFTYIVWRLWNKLPAHIQTSSKFSDLFYYTNVWTPTVLNISRTFFRLVILNRGINLPAGTTCYNNKFFHNSFTYIVSHLWNKLPAHIKTSSKCRDFTRNLKAFDFSKLGPSCHCNSCI